MLLTPELEIKTRHIISMKGIKNQSGERHL